MRVFQFSKQRGQRAPVKKKVFGEVLVGNAQVTRCAADVFKFVIGGFSLVLATPREGGALCGFLFFSNHA